jgi:hypothetical protein
VPIEINYKLKDLSKPKGDGLRDTASKQLLIVISTLEDTNKLTVLYRATPSLILERGATLGEQAVNSSIL